MSYRYELYFIEILLIAEISVRTRNTLYEVGARKSSICYDAVERRKMKKEKKEKKEKIVKTKYC